MVYLKTNFFSGIIGDYKIFDITYLAENFGDHRLFYEQNLRKIAYFEMVLLLL